LDRGRGPARGSEASSERATTKPRAKTG
jgi:hypothetical protein